MFDPLQVSVRYRCRNPRCGGKLPEPTDNRRGAFCCAGCHEHYFRNRCVVCEAKLPPGPSNRQICRRAQCRAEWRKFPQTYQWSKSGERPQTSAHSTGLKIGTKPGRGFRQVAGPALSETSLRLASLPLDPQTAARVRRANEQAYVDTTEIPTPSWPAILMGGGDCEHQLEHQARQLKLKQEKTR